MSLNPAFIKEELNPYAQPEPGILGQGGCLAQKITA